MKRRIIALAAVFVFFLAVGLWYNLQPGRYFHDEFWKLTGEGAYASVYGDSLRCGKDGRISLCLGGRELTAELSGTESGWRVDFSDGWAVELESSVGDVWVEVGGILLTGAAEYEIIDPESAGLRFGRADEEVREAFYDEDGRVIGESVYRLAETGEAIGWREIWYDNPEFTTPEQETVLLEAGARLQHQDFQQKLFVNADGEYLLNAWDAPMVELSGGRQRDRVSVAAMLIRAAEQEPGRRGSAAALLIYALLYLMGAVEFLWPEKVAFFGVRWQYRTEPELSDAGLLAAKAGGIAVMIADIVLLFVRQ